ncbi:MAG: hypothetical protein GX254_08665 [Clostridiales bacterium]|jgi:hypothetical protein|nr:hypothetical protein [Clostridiales bacterium]
MDNDREKLNHEAEVAEEYTLESILADYKSSAYIMGEKKLSKEELDRQAEKILREMTGGFESDDKTGEKSEQDKAPEPEEIANVEEQKATEGQNREDESGTADTENKRQKRRIFRKKRGEDKEFESSDKPSEEEQLPAQDTVSRPRKGEVVKASKKQRAEKLKKSDYKSQKEFEKRKEQLALLEKKQRRLLEEQKKKEGLQASYMSMSDIEQEFFGVGKYARPTSVIDNLSEVEEIIELETQRQKAVEERKKTKDQQQKVKDVEPADKEQDEPELSIEDALKLYGSGIKSIRRRSLLAFIICAAMAYFTFAQEYNLSIPEVFQNNPVYFSLFFLSTLIVVLFLGIDVFVTGLFDMFRARAGAESLVTLASLASIADAMFIIITGDDSRGLPFCAVAAFSVLLAMWGYRLSKSAYRKTLITLRSLKLPIVVSADWEKTDEGIVLTKKYGVTKGFISKCAESDYAERAYDRMAPMLIIASVIFSLISSVFKNQPQNFIHSFAAMTAASASFSSLIAFNLPFNFISRRLAASGAAIAGWSGASDIDDAIGMVVRDNDLFPENTLSFNGIKVFSNDRVDKVVSYAGSMILASGSGLSGLFSDLLREYACNIYRVDEFSCYEGGGIGADIKGDRVLVGSAAFMNLMGIRLSTILDIKSAVFIAINNELSGVFIINYTPVDSVRNALVSLINSKITPLFAVRDFNITPSMVKTKFEISTEEIEFPTFEARYYLSSDSDNQDIKPSAIMSRNGLGQFVEIVRSGRQLMSTVRKTVVLSVVGAIVGLLLMFFICYNGAFASGTPANTLTFMLFWLLPVLLLNGAGIRH